MKRDRLLSVFIYLLNRKKVSAAELASRFEVSVRTIQRDMDTLSMAGIPVYATRGKEGGYSIVDNYKIDRHFLGQAELDRLISILSRLTRVFNDSELSLTREKLLNLSSGKEEGEKEGHEKLIIDFNPWGIDGHIRKIFNGIFKYLEEKRVILIKYAAPSGIFTTREIEPLSIIMKGSSWYLYSFCRLRSGLRFFKLTRIMAISPCDEFFIPEVHPPYLNEPDKEDGDRELSVFVLRFESSAMGRITDYYNPDSLHFMPDGSIIGTFPFPEDEWVYSWILSFGPLVKVLEPEHAKNMIQYLLESMVEKYS